MTGDGTSTITELVLRDERAVCLADLYLGRLKRAVDEVPAEVKWFAWRSWDRTAVGWCS